jgi:hypothetical protein
MERSQKHLLVFLAGNGTSSQESCAWLEERAHPAMHAFPHATQVSRQIFSFHVKLRLNGPWTRNLPGPNGAARLFDLENERDIRVLGFRTKITPRAP